MSLDSQSPYGSLRIQFPCHPAKAGALWTLGILVNLRVEQQRRENHTTGLHPWEMPPLVPAAQKGGEATGDGSFPPTGIYYRLSQMRHVLRAFCIECASQLKLALRRVVVEVTLSFLPSYTLLPLRGTSPQGETRGGSGANPCHTQWETREHASSPCAPLEGTAI